MLTATLQPPLGQFSFDVIDPILDAFRTQVQKAATAAEDQIIARFRAEALAFAVQAQAYGEKIQRDLRVEASVFATRVRNELEPKEHRLKTSLVLLTVLGFASVGLAGYTAWRVYKRR